jgi:hypothetical protein
LSRSHLRFDAGGAHLATAGERVIRQVQGTINAIHTHSNG